MPVVYMVLAILGGFTTAAADTTVLLASDSVDLSGNGRLEVLEVIGGGPSLDSLNVTLVIRAPEGILYEVALAPITRVTGFDGGRRRLSRDEHEERIGAFAESFFAPEKFKSAQAFEETLRRSAPAHVSAIPEVIARDAWETATADDGARIWQAIKERGGTVFEYSPGGDAVVAIAWSQTYGRFYRLLECC